MPPDSDLTDNISYTVSLEDPYWQHCYLPLANSLSKHETTTDGQDEENDTSVDAFHQAYLWSGNPLKSSLDPKFIAKGRLAKSVGDTSDSWTIDIKVPCFYGQCAQEAWDEENSVDDDIPGFHVPQEFWLDPKTERKTFGTDLWIEVTEISLSDEKIGANLAAYIQPSGNACNINVGKDLAETSTTSKTINGGIVLAQNGDTVCVDDGIFNESVMINKQIRLSGSGSLNTSVINTQTEPHDGVYIGADNVVLEGFRINGLGPDYQHAAVIIGESRKGVIVRYNFIKSGPGANALRTDGFQNGNLIKENIFEGNNSPEVVMINGLPVVTKPSKKVDVISNTFIGTADDTNSNFTGTVITQHATDSLISKNILIVIKYLKP